MSNKNLAEDIGREILRTSAIFLNSHADSSKKLEAGLRIKDLLECAKTHDIDTTAYIANLNIIDEKSGGMIRKGLAPYLSKS